MKQLVLRSMMAILCVMVMLSGTQQLFAQKADNVMKNAQELMERYKPNGTSPINTVVSTEDPRESWQKYYAERQSNNVVTALRVNTMPSYSVNGAYANALAGQALAVWGNVSGGESPYTYYLEYGDGATESGTVTDPRYIGFSHAYALAGTKMMKLTVTDNLGASQSDSSTIRVYAAATQTININMAIEKGLLRLYLDQMANGSWAYSEAHTGIALLAFEENGHLPTNDFDADIYAEYVRLGLDFSLSYAVQYPISIQEAGNPDTDGDGYGAYLSYGVYENGVALLGVIGAHRDQASAQADTITTGVYAGQTFYDFMVDAVDQLYFSQGDTTSPGYYGRGGWRYNVNTPNNGSADNSAVQWCALVMEAAQNNWGMTIPAFVKNELRLYLQYSQGYDGGFGYTEPNYWNNIAKTAAGIASYVVVGEGSAYPAVDTAIGFLDAHWANAADNLGAVEHFNGNTYAMYAVAKGMRILDNRVGIVNIGSHNWYQEYANHLLTNPTWGQQSNGAWYDGYWLGGPNALSTSFAILVLTQGVVVPPPVAVVDPISSKPPNTPFTVAGSNSYHLDGTKSIVEWLWDWDASDGVDFNSPDASGQTPTNPGYATNGTKTITLRVKDNSVPPQYDLETSSVLISDTANHPPVAVAIPTGGAPQYAGRVGEPILLNGSDSYDPDAPTDSVVGYNWDTDGNGVYGDAFTDTVTVVFANEYNGQVGLRVYDTHGDSSTNNAYITVVASRKDIFVESFDSSPYYANAGESIHLVASFKNDATSNTGVSGALVRFYDGDPLTTGNQMGGDYFVDLPVGVSDTIDTYITLPSLPGGDRQIYVYLDPSLDVDEWDETNNILGADVNVGTWLTLRGMKFNDLDGDGIKDELEPGLANWEITLVGESRSVLTDANGNFEFVGVPAGSYTLREENQVGWTQTAPVENVYTISALTDSVITGLDFGNRRTANGEVHGMKFQDSDGDGILDDGEIGLAGWVIVLTEAPSASALPPVSFYDTTDANGMYAFTNLEPKVYIVSEQAQSGWLQTMPSSPNTYTKNVGIDSVFNNLNFGNFRYITVGGYKFEDAENDSTFNENEAMLSDWSFMLIQNGDTSFATTNGAGQFTFNNVGPGEYILAEVQQSGWNQTYPTNPPYYQDTPVSGKNSEGNTFGNNHSAGISGMKFNDLDGDGVKDEGEPGLPNWQIVLGGDASDTVLTSNSGAYSFSIQDSGTFTVTEIQQAGWQQTTSNPAPITLNLGESVSGVNFGNFKTPTISGIKFQDTDGDGVFDDSEFGLEGWTIKANKGLDEKTTVTDAEGDYSFSFTGSETGTWIISEVQQPGWAQTAPVGGTYEYNVVSALEVTNAFFGNFQSGSISGKKYNDIAGDSATAGDPNLNNWVINLYNDTVLVASDTTSGAGDYEFSGLAPGTYTVQEELQSGWIQTFPATGSYEVAIASGSNVTGKDFANFELGVISGVKFLDFDGDSVKDAGENGMSNWTILLTYGENQDTVVSDSVGAYSFSGLMAGSYTVTEVMKDGWYQTTPGAGFYTVNITSGSNEANRNFGNFEYGTISGTKYWDRDSNAVKDAQCESYLPGIKMVLFGSHTAPDTVTTDASGNFTFTNVPADNFTLTEASNVLWRQTFPANGAPYTMTMVSGLDTTGFLFGNFHVPDTSKFRTFIVSDYNKAARAKQKSGFIRNPTAGNVRDTVFWRHAFGLDTPTDSGYLRVGIKRPDSLLHYGWLFHRWQKYKGPAVKHWIYNMKIWGTKRDPKTKTNVPRNPAYYFGFVGEKVTETYFGNAGNHLTVEMVTLKTNVAASDVGITPQGLGDLLYVCRDNTNDSLFNGMTIREIIRRADTAVTMGRVIIAVGDTVYRHPVSYLNALDSAISRINREFRSLTVDTISTKPLKIKGTKGLYKVSYLMRDSLAPVPLANFDHISSAEEVPATYRLDQNYPNPFNPATTIQFELMVPSRVTLKIFNLLGQEVATILDNQDLEEGLQAIELDATDFSSGVYFYRLEANGVGEDGQTFNFKSVKKMMLMK